MFQIYSWITMSFFLLFLLFLSFTGLTRFRPFFVDSTWFYFVFSLIYTAEWNYAPGSSNRLYQHNVVNFSDYLRNLFWSFLSTLARAWMQSSPRLSWTRFVWILLKAHKKLIVNFPTKAIIAYSLFYNFAHISARNRSAQGGEKKRIQPEHNEHVSLSVTIP